MDKRRKAKRDLLIMFAVLVGMFVLAIMSSYATAIMR